MNLKLNLSKIKKEIGNAKLIAVTKTVDAFVVKELKKLGIDSFGENRLSAEQKIREINAEWHMIGHLQSNKVKLAVEIFDMIQSVDSIKLAKKIDLECEAQKKVMPILLQINIAKEPQKYGFRKEEIEEALEEVSKLKIIKIEGFMMMAPFIEAEQTRTYFKEMKILFDKYKKKYDLKWLSMGMSNDYKVALEEGSNMVRIGTKLFI